MKNVLATSIIISITITLTSLASSAKKPINPELTKQQFIAIDKQLDKGGDLLVIANVNGMLEEGVEWLKTFANASLSNNTNATTACNAINKLPAFLKKNGFYSIHGVGLSMIPKTNGLNNLKMYVSRDPASAKLPMWKALTGGEPRKMKCLNMIPENTSLLRTSTIDPDATWQLIKQGIFEFSNKKGQKAFDKAMASFKKSMGISVDDIATSLGDEIFFSIQTPESSVKPSLMMPFASFSLLAGIKTKNDTLFNLATNRIPMAITSKINGYTIVKSKIVNNKGPMQMSPCIAKIGKYLVLSLSEKTLNNAISTIKNKNDLTTTADFKKAFANLSMINNGISYITPQLSQKFYELQKQAMMMSYALGPNANLFNLNAIQSLITGKTNQMSALITTVSPAGILTKGISTTSGRELVASLSIAPMGLMVAIAIPSFVKARNTAQQNGCINNLRIIDSAKEQWALANRKKNGDQVNIRGVCEYIKGNRIPVCPTGGQYKFNVIGKNPTCSHKGHRLPQ